MFFQIKAVLKNSKPPVWRRAYIPSNITFTQLALILETILDLTQSDLYEFEFYQRKDRIIEWHEEDADLHDFYYSYYNGPDTFINEWFLNEKRFTFHYRNAKGQIPEYKVEIEKILEEIEDARTGEKMCCPVLVKEVSSQWSFFLTDGNIINQILEEKFFFNTGENDYLYIHELREHINKKKGLIISDTVINRDIHTSVSADKQMCQFTESLSERLNKEARKFGFLPETATSRYPSVEELLGDYKKDDLKIFAAKLGMYVSDKRKDKMVSELARILLDPQKMQAVLLQADEEELDAFENAIERGCFIPSEEEYINLAFFMDHCYLADYSDNYVEAPFEVVSVYNLIKKDNYREFHKNVIPRFEFPTYGSFAAF